MKEIFLFVAANLVAGYFIVRFAFDIRYVFRRHQAEKQKRLEKLIKLEVAGQMESERRHLMNVLKIAECALERKFFGSSIDDTQQNIAKTLAKNPENPQNNQEPDSPTETPTEFWKNIDQMKAMRDEIDAGNQNDYRNVAQLSELAPLDAMRTLDEKILEREDALSAPIVNEENGS